MSRRALALFIAMSVIWGIPYLFIRIAVSELPPAVLVFGRTGVAALILVPIALYRRELRGLASHWLPLVMYTAVEIGVPWLMLSNAEQHISSSLAGLLISAVPLVTTVTSLIFGGREQIGPLNIAGLLIGLLGVAAIVGFDLRVSDALAFVEVAIVVVGYALGPVIINRYLKDQPPVAVNAASLGVAAIAYAPVAALQWPHALPSVGVLAAVLILGVICTALAFLLYFALIAEIGPVRATVITYFNPAVAAVLGVLVLRESFNAGMAVGFVLVLIGSTIATRRRKAVVAAEVAR